MVKSCIKYLFYKLKYLSVKRFATFVGKAHNIGPTGHIVLSDGSDKSDIIIGDHVDIYGDLLSQNHGKIQIGNYSRISRNTRIQSVCSVRIGNHVVISRDSVVCDSNNHPLSVSFRKIWTMQFHNPSSSLHLWKYADRKEIIIEDNVWIGERCRICKGVTIGQNSVIGACSVVTKSVPCNCIAVGNPARVVKEEIDKIPDPKNCEEYNNFVKEYGKNV